MKLDFELSGYLAAKILVGPQPPPGAAPIPSVPVPAAPAEQLPAPAQNIQPEQPLLMPKRRMSYRGGNLQGIGSRSYQEDSFTFVNLLDVTKIREMGLFAVVADGMGGMQGGSFASQTVINTMKEAFQNMDRAGDLPEQLEHAIYAADENVFRELHGKGGSTVVAAMLYDEKLYYAGVGDSYFFLKRGNALYRINREQNVMHSVFLDTIRQGSVDPSAGEANEEKQALSQFVGMGEIIDVDQLYHPFPLMDGDILLLCSDGVGGVLTEEDILFALAHPSPQDMCTALDQSVQRANRTYQDNYTALVIQCSY